MTSALVLMGIKDRRALDAIGAVPRHLFLDPALAGSAYAMATPPIGFGQTLSSPYRVARMIELADPRETDRALEVGSGSGYQAALLARLVRRVYAIERINALSNRARRIFNELKIDNVISLVGDGSLGAPARYAPFDIIIVSAQAKRAPEKLMMQLADSGRAVIPIEDEDGTATIHIARRDKNHFKISPVEKSHFVPLKQR